MKGRSFWKIRLYRPLVLLHFAAGNWAAMGAEVSGSDRLAYEEPRSLTGSIYSRGSDTEKLLFKFQRKATRSGNKLNVQRDYTYPDGRLAAQESVVYEGNDLVFYELKETQIGAEGTAKIQPASATRSKGSIEFEYAKETGARPKKDSETLAENVLINDMVGPFLASNWDNLVRGRKVNCRYIVVPRAETVGFTFVKHSESKWHGRDVLIVKMEVTSRLLSVLVDPLFFHDGEEPYKSGLAIRWPHDA